MCVKTLMGLEPLEVKFFSGNKFTKFDLALKEVVKNRSKVVSRLSIMFFQRNKKKTLFLSKVICELHSSENFLNSGKK